MILKLPNMNEFSPGQLLLSLRKVLEVVGSHSGNRQSIVNSLVEANVVDFTKTEDSQKNGRASNVLIGMSQCGLYDKKLRSLTPFGKELLQTSTDNELHDRFAKHLLEHCHALELIRIAEAKATAGGVLNLEDIRESLRASGYKVTTNEGNPSKIRMWLGLAGLIDNNWSVNHDKLEKLIGLGPDNLRELSSLTSPQRVWLRSMKEGFPMLTWVEAAEIKQYCYSTHGPTCLGLDRDFRRKVLNPLAESGWIELEGKGKRGGKIGKCKGLKKLDKLSIRITLNDVDSFIPRAILDEWNVPMMELWKRLDSSVVSIKGRALEVLAVKMARILGLAPVAFRTRPDEIQHNEVDLMAEGATLLFSRWLFQCKNYPRSNVAASELARELGMALLLKAHVIVMVTTGDFSRSLKEHAAGINRDLIYQVVLIDGSHIQKMKTGGDIALVEGVRAQASRALTQKSDQRVQYLI